VDPGQHGPSFTTTARKVVHAIGNPIEKSFLKEAIHGRYDRGVGLPQLPVAARLRAPSPFPITKQRQALLLEESELWSERNTAKKGCSSIA
jgi:hypothetical protein